MYDKIVNCHFQAGNVDACLCLVGLLGVAISVFTGTCQRVTDQTGGVQSGCCLL